MSDVVLPERTNSGAASCCAWPGCPNGRVTFVRVEPRPGIGELLAACGRHSVLAEREPGVALRVWRDSLGRPAPKDHTDHVLAGSLLREITRVPGITRQRLIAWRRLQLPKRGLGPVETRSGQPTADDSDTDVLSALDWLVREKRVRARTIGMSGSGSSRASIDCAYFSLIDEEEPWTTTATTTIPVPTAAAPTARATRSPAATTSAAPAGAQAAAKSATPLPTGGSASIEPSSPSAEAVAPIAASPEPAPSRPSDDAPPLTVDPATPAADPPTTAAAPPTATRSPSDGETMSIADRLRTYLAAHPGQTTNEIGDAVGVKRANISAQLSNLAKQGQARRELERQDGKPPMARWWLTTAKADPPGTHGTPRAPETPAVNACKPPASVANTEQERAFKAKLAERTAERDALAAEKSQWIADEAALREWRCAIEKALGEPDEEIDASVAVAMIEKLRAPKADAMPRPEGRRDAAPTGEPMRVMQAGDDEKYGSCVLLTCDRTAARRLAERLYQHVTVSP